MSGYDYYNPKDFEGRNYSSISKITRKQGEQIAKDFLKKVAPSKADEVVLKPSKQNSLVGSTFHNYNFNQFNRVIKGVEYPSNYINIEVNGQSGEVRSFYSQWEHLNISPVSAKLTAIDAQKIFNDKFGLELRYFKPQPRHREQSKSLKKVYEITNPHQISIDALTGEIVFDDNYWPYFRENDGAADMQSMGSANTAKEELEPFEQEIVDEIAGLLSKEEALAIAQKFIAIPSGFTLRNSGLRNDWGFPQLKIWSFNWELEEKNRYGWVSVEVDAKTGKILSFNISDDYTEGSKENKKLIIKNRTEAEKLVQDYLKANYPETVGKLQARPNFSNEIDSNKDQANYSFDYERLVGDIPFGQNFVSANVNSYTGKITSFQIRFLDMDFPTYNVLDKDQFQDDYFKNNPMNLVYTKDKEKKLRLVYKLAPSVSYRFDAVTGDKLDGDGEVIKDTTTLELTDIKGHWAESDINLLNELGLLYIKDNKFNPDGQLTQAEMLKMLVKSNYIYLNDSTKGNWYDSYYEQGKNSGLILEKEINPNAVVTKEELAKFMTRTLVWDKIANLDIYQPLKYSDASQISDGYQGYVSIISKLGLITGSGNTFAPKTQVKKGEAAVIMVHYLRMERQNV